MGVKKVYLLLPWQCYNQFNMRRYSKKKVADSTEQVSIKTYYSQLNLLHYLKSRHKLAILFSQFSCVWQNRPCHEEDFQMSLTDHGVCYSFFHDEEGEMVVSSSGTLHLKSIPSSI